MAKMTRLRPPAPPVQAAGKIGLWGAPTCGKTTFLAALSIAATRKREQRIRLFGADDQSTDFLVKQTAMLTRNLQFPPATAAKSHLNWVLHMPVEAPARRFERRKDPVRYAFNLSFIDVPGDWFDDGRGTLAAEAAHLFGDEPGQVAVVGTAGDDEAFLRELASCDGLVLLFDPTKEWQNNDVFQHFYGTLMKIAQRRLQDPAEGMELLPQYVAVCTTKFDHNDVFRKAYERGFVSPAVMDGLILPRINNRRAEEFFVSIGRESPLSYADLVRDMLRSFFAEDRVQFFVSSAIGFRLGSDGIFDEGDFANVDRTGSVPRIKGPIYPINVIEPLMWLGQKLADGQ